MKLEYNEIICPECNGEKYTEIEWTPYYNIKKLCKRCKGNGKLDWIDNMLNRKQLQCDRYLHELHKPTDTSSFISESITL